MALDEDGQDVLLLHLMGFPLATTQADMTLLQKQFARVGLPYAYKKLHGGDH